MSEKEMRNIGLKVICMESLDLPSNDSFFINEDKIGEDIFISALIVCTAKYKNNPKGCKSFLERYSNLFGKKPIHLTNDEFSQYTEDLENL